MSVKSWHQNPHRSPMPGQAPPILRRGCEHLLRTEADALDWLLRERLGHPPSTPPLPAPTSIDPRPDPASGRHGAAWISSCSLTTSTTPLPSSPATSLCGLPSLNKVIHAWHIVAAPLRGACLRKPLRGRWVIHATRVPTTNSLHHLRLMSCAESRSLLGPAAILLCMNSPGQQRPHMLCAWSKHTLLLITRTGFHAASCMLRTPSFLYRAHTRTTPLSATASMKRAGDRRLPVSQSRRLAGTGSSSDT